MGQNNSQPDRQKLLQMLADRTGRDPAALGRELDRGNLSGLLGSMDAASRAEAERVLGDPELMKKMLSSPQVKELLRRLGG